MQSCRTQSMTWSIMTLLASPRGARTCRPRQTAALAALIWGMAGWTTGHACVQLTAETLVFSATARGRAARCVRCCALLRPPLQRTSRTPAPFLSCTIIARRAPIAPTITVANSATAMSVRATGFETNSETGKW